MHSNIIFTSIPRPSDLFPSDLSSKILYVFLINLIPRHLILLGLIALKYEEEYKLRHFSLWNFLNPPVTFSLLGSKILIATTFRNFLFLWPGIVCPPPNLKATGPPLVDCPRLFIQCTRSYPPYLEAVSSIHNLRTRHTLMSGAHLILSVSFRKHDILNTIPF